MHVRAPQRAGFTLIEILVVVAIIALLVAVLLPSLSNARKTAKQVVCLSNQKQFANANFYYATDFKGLLPHTKDWLYTGGKSSATNKANQPLPESGVLMGQRIPGQPKRRAYINQKELFKCPMDDGSRNPGASQIALQPANFSFSRNVYIIQAMQDAKLYSGSSDYFPMDKPKFPSRTPLMVEEMTVGPYALSPLNDPEFWISGLDKLTDRHLGRSVLSYHDQHAEMANSRQYNTASTTGSAASYQHLVMAPGIPWNRGP